jgi:DNA repair photolyase
MIPKEEPNADIPLNRLNVLHKAHSMGIKTWVSFEPVINANAVLSCMKNNYRAFDKVKIGKLNYYPSDIDWCTEPVLAKDLSYQQAEELMEMWFYRN